MEKHSTYELGLILSMVASKQCRQGCRRTRPGDDGSWLTETAALTDDLTSVPSTYLGQLTTICNTHFRAIQAFLSVGTSTHLGIHTYTKLKIKIVSHEENKPIYFL